MSREFKPVSLEPIEIARFWDKLQQRGRDECWLWLRGGTKQGYGLFTSRERSTYLAHRIAYWLANGDFDWQLVIRHSCHNPKCCNPKHLRAGTHQDNIDDTFAAGRQSKAPGMRGRKGTAHPASKYDEEQRRAAIQMYFRGSKFHRTHQQIADIIGCHRQSVMRWCRDHSDSVHAKAQVTHPIPKRETSMKSMT